MTVTKTLQQKVAIIVAFAVFAGAFAVSGVAHAQVAPTCTIYANPSNVSYTGTTYTPVTLTWNSTNATSANLTNVGSVSTNGSQIFYPSVTTTYILNVYNAQGMTGQCQTTVYVSGTSSSMPSCWITLTQQSQQYGNQPTTLSWGSNNATSATITSLGSVSTSGSQTVYPSGNQVYTMTVYGSQGTSAQCQTSQYSYPYQPYPPYQPPYQPGGLSCSITANPSTIVNGQTSYLSWTSSGNATSAWLSDGLSTVGPNGTLAVHPTNSRTYTLTVSGPGGTQTCNTYITVAGSYVPLTQIPYTGFDTGTFGTALYWLALASFALAAGYLVVFYLPRTALGKTRLPELAENRVSTSQHVEIPALFRSDSSSQ